MVPRAPTHFSVWPGQSNHCVCIVVNFWIGIIFSVHLHTHVHKYSGVGSTCVSRNWEETFTYWFLRKTGLCSCINQIRVPGAVILNLSCWKFRHKFVGVLRRQPLLCTCHLCFLHILLAPHSSATDIMLSSSPTCLQNTRTTQVVRGFFEYKVYEVIGCHRWSSTTMCNLSTPSLALHQSCSPLHPQLSLLPPMLLPPCSLMVGTKTRRLQPWYSICWAPVCTPVLLPGKALLTLLGRLWRSVPMCQLHQTAVLTAAPWASLVHLLWLHPVDLPSCWQAGACANAAIQQLRPTRVLLTQPA